jgi:hypothetical protein
MKLADRKNRHEKPFVADSRVPFTLDLGGKILKAYLIIRGTVTLAGGTTSGAVAGRGGPSNLIKKIVVRCTGAGRRYPDTVAVDCTPDELLTYDICQYGKFSSDLGAVDLGDGDAGTYEIYTSIPIYFADSNYRRQYATGMNADPNAFSAIQVEVQTGDIKNCFIGNDRTATYNLTLEWRDERDNSMSGDTLILVQEGHTALINAAQDRFTDGSMPKDGAFLFWHLMTEVNAPTVRTLSDAILDKVVIEGENFSLDLKERDLRQTLITDGWYDKAQTATGQYVIEFTDGMITRAVPARTLDAKFKVLNPTGANLDGLHFYTRRVFEPKDYDPKVMAEYKG